jgi:hypothetical protein
MNVARIPTKLFCAAAAALSVSWPAFALDAGAQPDFATLEASQNAANATPGVRSVPGRTIPVPNTASPALQATIAAPYRVPAWDANPKSAADWKDLINKLAAAAAACRRAYAKSLASRWSLPPSAASRPSC